MDTHLHERTDCPACLNVPLWQWGNFQNLEDLCEYHQEGHKLNLCQESDNVLEEFDDYEYDDEPFYSPFDWDDDDWRDDGWDYDPDPSADPYSWSDDSWFDESDGLYGPY